MTSPVADLLFSNGPVFTPPGPHSPGTPTFAHDTVAVLDGRIVAFDDEARAMAGAGTQEIDLAGKLLVPGFQDAHIHAVAGGLELGQCDLTGVVDQDALLARIAAYASANPHTEWITGAGWSLETFEGGLPTRRLLDSVVPDRPALLYNRDHHGAWTNTRALELAGITASSPDPVDGRIERDADGHPTGMLQEGAVLLVARHIPEPSQADLDTALLRAQQYLHSLGITGWQDAIVGTGMGLADNLPVYVRAARSGALTARVRGALWWDRERGLEQLDELLIRREAGRVGRFTAGSVKIMQDGIIENRTAALTQPYLDACGCSTGESGLSFVDPKLLPGIVTELDRHGFQVHFHALGDRAVREALDAIEAAHAANGPSTNRHHLAHLQVVHPDDVARFARIGATANIQPLWASHEPQMDGLAIPLLGARRTTWQYPFASLVQSGTTLAAGSDWPVSSPDPIAGLHVAVNRVQPDGNDEPFLPVEQLSLTQALTAYTAGSAWVNHHDDTGTIRRGASADLVVLDRNPFAYPAAQIHRTRVLATFVRGERVWAQQA
ncbi:amidohydrolase [Kitasatospora paranensis]|uniref:Amidohydrolase n=1 Tax=Kitasatospora paranensis TaxID=258053 RepID=A0ABW2G1T8_9ACTN